MARKALAVIAKPTHACNIACKYCYIDPKAEAGSMSQQILSQSIEKVSDYADSSHWIWHGGEPLLMGLDFYKTIKDIQDFYRQRGKRFTNGIQTNATLLTDEFLDFFEETQDFHIGTSIDGPRELHNASRIYQSGKGSYDEVMRGINLMKKRNRHKLNGHNRNGVGGGAICVISKVNVDYPQELYDFFKSQSINVKFNPIIESGRAKGAVREIGITPKQYSDFLITLWRIYDDDVRKEGKVTIDIDPFMDIIGNIGTGKPVGCNYSISCRNSFISIGPQGDIYPCGRFDGEQDFWMGNVQTHTIEEALNSPVHKKLIGRSLETVAGCKNCEYNQICNSGCMHNAYFAGDVMGKDFYCSSYKKIFAELAPLVKLELENAERRFKEKSQKNG